MAPSVPTLYLACLDVLGLDVQVLKLIATFGFFVALAFLAAARYLAAELARKWSAAKFRDRARTLPTPKTCSLPSARLSPGSARGSPSWVSALSWPASACSCASWRGWGGTPRRNVSMAPRSARLAFATGFALNVWASLRHRVIVRHLHEGTNQIGAAGPIAICLASGVGGLILIVVTIRAVSGRRAANLRFDFPELATDSLVVHPHVSWKPRLREVDSANARANSRASRRLVRSSSCSRVLSLHARGARNLCRPVITS